MFILAALGSSECYETRGFDHEAGPLRPLALEPNHLPTGLQSHWREVPCSPNILARLWHGKQGLVLLHLRWEHSAGSWVLLHTYRAFVHFASTRTPAATGRR
jgi:hypothetical protein